MEFWSEGWTDQQILMNYPQLKAEDLRTAHAYAADVVKGPADLLSSDLVCRPSSRTKTPPVTRSAHTGRRP